MGSAVQKNGFSKTMKSGPGPSTIALSVNSTTICPPWPSDMTESDPLIGVASPGGPSTIPGCQVLVPGGEETVPSMKETTRSAKQSVVASARASGVPARRTATVASARNEGRKRTGLDLVRIMATPREAERSRRIAGERVPENDEHPDLLRRRGAWCVREVPLPRKVRHEQKIAGRFPGSRLSTRRPFPEAARPPVGDPGFRYRSQLRGSGGFAPPSLFNRPGQLRGTIARDRKCQGTETHPIYDLCGDVVNRRGVYRPDRRPRSLRRGGAGARIDRNRSDRPPPSLRPSGSRTPPIRGGRRWRG